MTRRARPGSLVLAVLLTMGLGAYPALATAPSPLAPSQFAFPGSFAGPASAVSAGLALADRWLGDEPFANPAVAPEPGVAASGTMLRVSRQDLRANNRNYDETLVFFDGAGAALGLAPRGRLGVALYAFQPVLRFEDNAYSRGPGTPDPANPPAVVQTHASAREIRAGVAVSSGLKGGRIGLGIEWTRRQDVYESAEQSGNPANAGTKRLELSGDGISVQVGARLDRGDSSVGGYSLGVGARYLPALRLEGPHAENLLVATMEETLHVTRQAGWELGGTARIVVRPSVRVLAAVGGRTAQRWEGLDLRAGPAWEWKLAWEYHDLRDPWTLRFGLGQEFQSQVPEPRTLAVGVGLGWRFANGAVDLGVLHRTLGREAEPNSFDDRVVLSVHVPL